MNGKYCECSNMDCPKDPDSGLLCGGKANLLYQHLNPIQQHAYSPHRLPYTSHYASELLVGDSSQNVPPLVQSRPVNTDAGGP